MAKARGVISNIANLIATNMTWSKYLLLNCLLVKYKGVNK